MRYKKLGNVWLIYGSLRYMSQPVGAQADHNFTISETQNRGWSSLAHAHWFRYSVRPHLLAKLLPKRITWQKKNFRLHFIVLQVATCTSLPPLQDDIKKSHHNTQRHWYGPPNPDSQALVVVHGYLTLVSHIPVLRFSMSVLTHSKPQLAFFQMCSSSAEINKASDIRFFHVACFQALRSNACYDYYGIFRPF